MVDADAADAVLTRDVKTACSAGDARRCVVAAGGGGVGSRAVRGGR